MLHENLIGKKYSGKTSIEHECIKHLQKRSREHSPSLQQVHRFLEKQEKMNMVSESQSKWLSLTFASTTRNVGYAGNIRMKLTVELFQQVTEIKRPMLSSIILFVSVVLHFFFPQVNLCLFLGCSFLETHFILNS